MTPTDFVNFLWGPLEFKISKVNAMDLFMQIDDNGNEEIEENEFFDFI